MILIFEQLNDSSAFVPLAAGAAVVVTKETQYVSYTHPEKVTS